MLFPESRRFWVTLHCRSDWDDMTRRDRGALLMVDPPLVESSIGLYVESLFWGRSFGGCIRDIGPKNEQVLGGSNSIE